MNTLLLYIKTCCKHLKIFCLGMEYFMLGASNCRAVAMATGRQYIYIPFFNEENISKFIQTFDSSKYPKKCVLWSNTNNLIQFKRRFPTETNDTIIHIHFKQHMKKRNKLHCIIRQTSRLIHFLILNNVEIILISHFMRCLTQTCLCTAPEKYYFVRPLAQKVLFQEYERIVDQTLSKHLYRFIRHIDIIKTLYEDITTKNAPKNLTCNDYMLFYKEVLKDDQVHFTQEFTVCVGRFIDNLWTNRQ